MKRKRLEPLKVEETPSDTVFIIYAVLMMVFFCILILYGLNGVFEHFYYGLVI